MKAMIITCYESNEERATFVMETLKELGYEVKVLTSNFSHFRKEIRTNVPKEFDAIPTFEYHKNLSLERLNSHSQFAFDAFMTVEDFKPDLLWVMIPCNSLVKRASIYKKKHQDVKLIFDVIDMWPESLPVKVSYKKTLPFKLWRNIRTKYIKRADQIVSECDLYKGTLSQEYAGIIKTIHWAKNNNAIIYKTNLPKDKLSLLYLGSINNIIDINEIARLVKTADMPIVLHIVGDGENKDLMIQTLGKICEVEYHGKVYDQIEKEEIFSKCHAGLNIYKQDLYIGLTVKCIDYFMYGLPIINNIKGDTWKFVESENVGINVDNKSKIETSSLIELRNNNNNIYKLYNENFSKMIFKDKVKEVIERVVK